MKNTMILGLFALGFLPLSSAHAAGPWKCEFMNTRSGIPTTANCAITFKNGIFGTTHSVESNAVETLESCKAFARATLDSVNDGTISDDGVKWTFRNVIFYHRDSVTCERTKIRKFDQAN